MKPIYFVTVVLFLFLRLTPSLIGQENIIFKRNEFRAGYGLFSLPYLSASVNDDYTNGFMKPVFPEDESNVSAISPGTMFLGYNRVLNKKITIGMVLALNPVKSVVQFPYKPSYNQTFYYVTFMPRVDFHYLSRGIFSLYSGLAIGPSFYIGAIRKPGKDEKEEYGWLVAYQINAMGIRIGKEVGGFAEFGFGYLGWINFGIFGSY